MIRKGDFMKLDFDKIKEITCGAVRTEETAAGIRFYRFTKEQETIYEGVSASCYEKSLSTAGIKLRFKTNSTKLKLCAEVKSGSSRTFFAFDVFVDGSFVDSLDNFTGVEIPKKYDLLQLNISGEHSKEFNLGDGDKYVMVYLPWSVAATVKEISVDDGAYVEAVSFSKKLLAYGDSITQGYDALHPSSRYISKLAEALDAEEVNKAIGGEVFRPALAKAKEEYTPDYITVAYGTNDWSHKTMEEFRENCKGFYLALREEYPDAKIFALAPIWRKDSVEMRDFGKFCEIEQCIAEIVEEIGNIHLISCFDFIPKEEKYFADLRLHPNDEGFEYYAQNLAHAVKEKI